MFRAFQHKNFRLFFIGQFISLIGFWMQVVGQSWLVYRLTHSSAYLGAITFAQQIPILLLSLPAGGVADRTNRHRMVVLTQFFLLLQASVLTVLTFLRQITIPELMVLAVVLGIISAFDLPARQSFLIQMVGKEDLTNAIALNSSMFNAARVIGPAIAGFVVAKWGEAFCFLFNALSYIAVLVALLLMSVPARSFTVRQSLREDLVEGFQFIRNTKPVCVMLGLIGIFGISGFSFTVLLPIFADQIFNRGAEGLGWLMTGVGLGALLGALFLAARKGIKGISKVITLGAFGFPSCLLIFSINTNFWLSFMTLCFTGFFMMITIASINTAIQSMIPDAVRGRVMSFFTTLLIGTAPIGSLIAGTAAKYAGVQLTIFASAVFCLTGAYWFRRSLPKITTEARRLYLLQNPEPAP